MDFYTDVEGRMWRIIDFKMIPPRDKKRRVATGALEARGRAFHREFEQTRIYWFGKVAYRDLSQRTLSEQFRHSHAIATKAASQFWNRAGG